MSCLRGSARSGFFPGTALNLAAALLLLAVPSLAQWSPDFRVTNDPAVSVTETDGGRNVAVSGDRVGVVWTDVRDGNQEIYFRERIGTEWGMPLRLTNDPALSHFPAIGMTPGLIRVVWQDFRSGHAEIWAKARVSGSWSADTCLTCDDFDSARPALDHKGEHLVWEETKDGNREIYYRNLVSLEPSFRVSNDPGESSHPSVGSDHEIEFPGQDPFLRIVAWQDDRDGNWEIYSRITWDGSNWEPEVRVSADSASSVHPSVAAEIGVCGDLGFVANWVVWQDDRHANDEIYFAEGVYGMWNTAGRLTTTAAPSRRPSVSLAHQALVGPFGTSLCPRPAAVWEERGTTTDGTIMFLDLSGADPAVPVSDVGSHAWNVSIASRHVWVPGELTETFEVVWTDLRFANQEIFHSQGDYVRDVTDVPEVAAGPTFFDVSPARPTPFRHATELSVRLERELELAVRVVDASGRVVTDLFRGRRPAGSHVFSWDGRNADGGVVAAGVYFLRIEAREDAVQRKVVLLR